MGVSVAGTRSAVPLNASIVRALLKPGVSIALVREQDFRRTQDATVTQVGDDEVKVTTRKRVVVSDAIAYSVDGDSMTLRFNNGGTNEATVEEGRAGSYYFYVLQFPNRLILRTNLSTKRTNIEQPL